MSATDPYFQFPACLLAYSTRVEDRLNSICSWCVVSVGKAAWEKLTADQRKEHTEQLRQKYPEKLKKNSSNEEAAAMLGANMLRVLPDSPVGSVNCFHEVASFIRQHESRHGTDVTIRIRADIFWDAKDNHVLTYREFAILCALFSCIGNNAGAVCARIEMILARAMGYKSPAIMRVELANRKDGAVPFTRSQVRTTLDKLHTLEFFSRCYPGTKEERSRDTYYSNRLTNEQLREAVLKRRTYWKEFKATQTTANHALKLKIDEKLNGLRPIKVAKSPAIKVAIFEPESSPHPRQVVASESPQTSPVNRHIVATIIETLPTEPLETETLQTQPQERESALSLLTEGKAAEPEPEPEEVRTFLRGLFNAERFTEACMEARPWVGSRRAWRDCVATWATDRLNHEKRGKRKRRKAA